MCHQKRPRWRRRCIRPPERARARKTQQIHPSLGWPCARDTIGRKTCQRRGASVVQNCTETTALSPGELVCYIVIVCLAATTKDGPCAVHTRVRNCVCSSSYSADTKLTGHSKLGRKRSGDEIGCAASGLAVGRPFRLHLLPNPSPARVRLAQDATVHMAPFPAQHPSPFTCSDRADTRSACLSGEATLTL